MLKDISILFSGGPDSTLAALVALQKANRVHLLTFHHGLMGKVGRHKNVVNEMKRVFGETRIIAREERIDDFFKKFYFTKMPGKIMQYRTFYIPWTCGVCKMAMHYKTITYNRQHDISLTYDGANVEAASYFPAQTKNYIEVAKGLYRSFGMEYDCPVYDVEGTDKETEKFGLTSTRDTKKEHVFFSTQHTCFVGLLIHAHARLYYRPLRGKNRMCDLAGEFLGRMIHDCRFVT